MALAYVRIVTMQARIYNNIYIYGFSFADKRQLVLSSLFLFLFMDTFSKIFSGCLQSKNTREYMGICYKFVVVLI